MLSELRRARKTLADELGVDPGRALRELEADVRPRVLAELGRMEVMGDGPSALLHLREAYDTLTDDRGRAAVAQMLARTMVFAGGLGEATAFPRTAAAALPEDLVDERLGLLAVEHISGSGA